MGEFVVMLAMASAAWAAQRMIPAKSVQAVPSYFEREKRHRTMSSRWARTVWACMRGMTRPLLLFISVELATGALAFVLDFSVRT